MTEIMPPADADDAAKRRAIVGTWKLVSVVYEDVATKERSPVYGEHPCRPADRHVGRTLARAGHCRRPADSKTDAERARALQTMIAYTGRYRIEGGKVITKVEAAWNQAWVGGEQVRAVRFDGDKLYIESPPIRTRT